MPYPRYLFLIGETEDVVGRIKARQLFQIGETGDVVGRIKAW